LERRTPWSVGGARRRGAGPMLARAHPRPRGEARSGDGASDVPTWRPSCDKRGPRAFRRMSFAPDLRTGQATDAHEARGLRARLATPDEERRSGSVFGDRGRPRGARVPRRRGTRPPPRSRACAPRGGWSRGRGSPCGRPWTSRPQPSR
jgi:hypothetical protein